MSAKTILIVGTADTKSDGLAFVRNKVQSQGAKVLVMDVGAGGRRRNRCDERRQTTAVQA